MQRQGVGRGALRELRGALKPVGMLSVTEIFGDPHHLGAYTVLKEAETAGSRIVGRFGSFPAYTLNFEKEPGRSQGTFG